MPQYCTRIATTPPTAGRRGRRSSARGFALVEAISAMVILGTIASVTAGIIWRGAESYQSVATDTELFGELAAAMDRVERTLRELPGKGGAKANLNGVAASSVQWTSGATACSVSLVGDQLLMTSDSSGSMVLLAGVTDLAIQTYDASNGALTGPLSGAALDAVQRISVSITIARNGRSATLRSKVFLRCCSEGAN